MMNLSFFILFSVVIRNVNGSFGQAARVSDNKYAAAIFYNGSYICSGAIVDPRYILTAGHCLNNRIATEFDVVVGVNRMTASTFAYPVEKVFIHPRFSIPFLDSNIAANDIGLIKLEWALTFGETVQSIPLSPTSGPEYRLSCKQVLYRKDETVRDRNEMELRSSNVVVTTLDECKKFYFGQIFENQMCIFNIWKTRNPLPGDSGSPTVCNGQVFGVLSSGLDQSLPVRGPAKIMTVAPYLNWITCTMGSRR